MTTTEYAACELTREECLSLLPTAPFGRLVFTQGALPAVLTVNFLLDPGGIVIRTVESSSLLSAVGSGVVAFQADDIDVATRTGWTVTVVGQAVVVRDALQVARLSELPLRPWVAGDRNTFLVVETGLVSGRRIGGPEPAHSAT